MNDWRARLREADANGPDEMPAAEAQRMRHLILAEAAKIDDARAALWPRSFIVSAAALTMACIAMVATLQRVEVKKAPPLAVTVEAVNPPERTQLHFSTPGGTRIIWVFDSQFDVKGTTP